jgi:hypothetical protein
MLKIIADTLKRSFSEFRGCVSLDATLFLTYRQVADGNFRTLFNNLI